MKKTIPIFWLVKRIEKRIPALVLLTAAHAGQAILSVCLALGSRKIIDRAVEGNAASFYIACGQQIAIIVGVLFCSTVSRYVKEKLNAKLDRDWKQQLLHNLLKGDYTQLSKYHSAEILNRINNDVKTVDDGILTVVPQAFSMFVRLVTAVAVLAVLDPIFTAVIVVIGVLMIIATGFLRRRLKMIHKKVSEQDGVVFGFIQEVIEKVLVVQAMDIAEEVEKRADILLSRRYQMHRKQRNVSIFANTGASIMTYGASVLALFWCSGQVLQGIMSFGTLTAVTQLVGQLQAPFVGLSGVFTKYIAMTASVDRLMELDAIPVDVKNIKENPIKLYEDMTVIGAEHLTFTYDGNTVLRDVSFELQKGTFTAITGSSGIGKSTLLKLLLGVFKIDDGQLYVQTTKQRKSIDRSTRRLFAYVPQGNLLFSGSLRENIMITNPNATEEELAQAVYVSAISEFISDLPQGMDTYIGENAAGLSEGQAQRIAIARAILSGAPILLLDECTSALDEETERLVLERISTLRDKTCIAVTHRSSALVVYDYQIEIQNGMIVQKKIR